jgi:hypothetical protein
LSKAEIETATTRLSRVQVRELTGRATVLIRRALLTLQALPDRERAFLKGPKSAWPTPIDDPPLGYGYEPASERRARFKPTPADVERCLPVCGWLTWLRSQGDAGERGARIIVLHGLGVPYWKIAPRLDQRRSDETVRRWEAAALEAIALRFRAEIEAMG